MNKECAIDLINRHVQEEEIIMNDFAFNKEGKMYNIAKHRKAIYEYSKQLIQRLEV